MGRSTATKDSGAGSKCVGIVEKLSDRCSDSCWHSGLVWYRAHTEGAPIACVMNREAMPKDVTSQPSLSSVWPFFGVQVEEHDVLLTHKTGTPSYHAPHE
jgi:hypothetical protein